MIATSRFDFSLPAELVAQRPAERRDGSRLLVVDRASHTIRHHRFSDLPDFLHAGDTLFRNSASVLPARLRGARPGGGAVECLLISREVSAGAEEWRCLLRPGRKLKEGASFEINGGLGSARVLRADPDGTSQVRFELPGGGTVEQLANQTGEMPLPPYIDRSQGPLAEDRERYQTVYADRSRQVAVAAPTAGLHFTGELLSSLRSAGVRTADLTLHVGLGTFRPIATDTVESHPIHAEVYEIPASTQRALFETRPGRRVAVGTTTVRSVEDFLAVHDGPLDRTHVAEARLFIHPPRTFRGVEGLLTNFHQPKSTLLCLVSAFLTPGSEDGIDWLMEIYREAISLGYRFFSYGDAMLIL